MINVLIQIVQMLANILSLLVVASVLLSYFLSPYHPIRVGIDRVIEPFLSPIRKIVPPIQMIDFSPVVLIILIQVIESVLIALLTSMG